MIRVLFILILMIPTYGYGELYYWVDDNGVKHFSNYQPKDNSVIIKETKESVRDEIELIHQENQELTDPKKESDDKQVSVKKQYRKGSGPKVNITFKYYEFVSVNTNDIRDEMTKKTPIRYNGQKFVGSAEDQIKYFFYAKQEDGYWYFDRVTTTVDVTFTMPKWTDYRKANRDQQGRWDEYYNSLLAHENGHKDIAIEAAKTIENELLKLKNFPKKDLLESKAKLIAKAILERYRERQRQFDQETGHGVKTGVILH